MPNSLLDLYRKYNEENGIVDDTPDYFVVKDVLGPWAQKNPRIREAFPDFAKEYDAIREANSPGTLGGLKNTAKTAYQRSLQGLKADPTALSEGAPIDAKGIAELERDIQARPSSVPWEDWQRTEGEEARKVFMRDPIEITANIITSGFSGSVPAMVAGLGLGAAGAKGGGLLGGSIGGPPGALIGGTVGGIAGAAVGTGAGSSAVEYGIKYLDVLRDEGADLTDPESIRRVLEDPEVRAKARGLAFRRGIPVAVFDAVSAGLAGKFFKGLSGATRGQIVRKGLAEGGVQAVFDAGGEITGALSAGEKVSPGAVFEEVAGGAGPTLVEVGGAAMRRNITNRPATPGAGPAGGLEAPNRMEDPVVEPEAEVPARPAVRTNREAVLAAYAIPDEQVAARVAELQALPVLSADQNVELEILLSRAPATPVVVTPPEQPAAVAPVIPPVASETAAVAPGFGILPAAPTPLATETLVETPAAAGTPVGMPAPGSVVQPAPAAAVPPAPLQYTIQRPQEFEGRLIPGYVQIERTIDARGEPLTDAERAAAPQPPEWLPTGQYTEQQVLEAIAQGPAAPQPAQPNVQIPEPVIPQAPVAQADAAVRLLEPDQQVAQPIEQTGVQPAGQVPVVPPEPVSQPVVVTPFDEWEKAQRDYRARLINDEEFLAARAKWDAVQKAFDESRGELPPAAALPAEQAAAEAPKAELSPEAKLALWKKQNSKPTGRRLQFSYLPDGTPDLLNQIHEVGGIKPPGPGERGGEYDEFGDIFSGSWKILVRKGGRRIEQVADELGYDDVEKFKRAVEAAKVLRKKEFARFEMQSKEEAFANVVLEGKGRAKDKVGKPESADTLFRGDRFKADKEAFEVVDILENGDVLVNDGPRFGTQRIPAGATFYPDRRTLRRVPRGEATFLDEEDLSPVAPESAPKPEPALPPKEAAPVVAATPDLPKPTELKPTVPSAALTPDEKAAVELAQVPGVEPVLIPQGGSSAAYDTVMGIYAAEKHFTLWLAQRNPNTGQLGRWHYIGILGQNKEQARERALATAKKIGRGDMTGVAFIGKDQFRQPTALGVFETTLTEAELTGIEKMALGNQQIGFGKNGSVLVKDIWAKDQKWAMWAAANMTSGRGKQIADYIRALPEYIIAQDAAKVEVAEALTGDVEQVLKDFQLTGTAQGTGNILVGGNTYEWKDTIKQFGGRFDGETKSWSLEPAKFAEFVAKLRTLPRVAGGQGATLPAYVADPRLGKLREDSERRPDRSGFAEPITEYIGPETSELIARGEKVGMPRLVVDEQIEDVARINRAYRQGKPLFLLASQPGSGKTFVLGGAIRELRKSGAKKIVYVTLRKELITQIKADLADYGIGEVEFITYPEMRKRGGEASDVLIFDEAHAIRNVGGEGEAEVLQAEMAKKWIKAARFTLFSTATPYESPVQTAYLEPTGIFSDPFGTFENFAMAHGARKRKFKDGTEELFWKRGPTSDADSRAAREFLRKEGVFTSRKTRLPVNMVDSRMVKIMADAKAEARYTALTEAAIQNEDRLTGFAIPWIKNFQKRLLEASKVKAGILEADAALKRGRFPIIFVETKAERNINIPELQDKEDAYNAAVAMAMSMRDKPPARKEFGLPPNGIVEVLTSYMNKTGESVIEIPSAEDLVRSYFGAKTAIFTGSVTPQKAQENLDAWRRGEKPVIVATMAKGGTGLSLHDKVGDHPTTQINVNLPWTATSVVQVAQRSARYGLKSPAEMQWIFAENIPFDRMLAARVGGRMADMGSVIHGERLPGSAEIEEWSFDNKLFSETAKEAQEVAAAPAAPQPTGVTPELLAKQTFEELAGQMVVLEGYGPDGLLVEGQVDAAEAWADTQKSMGIYKRLLNCLKDIAPS